MNGNKLFLSCCLALAGLITACDSENAPENDGAKAISLNSTVNQRNTRADSPYTQIMSGQKVGVYVHETGGVFGNLYANEEFTSGGEGVLTGAHTLYYPPSGNVDIVAYHPIMTSPATTGVDFIVNSDQSSDTDYYNSDLLYAEVIDQEATTSKVDLTFAHKLSNVTYTLNNVSGNSVKVTLKNIERAVNFKIADGSITDASSSSVGDVILNNAYGAVVAPQSIGNTTHFTALIDGNSYTSDNIATAAFTGGMNYKYNLTLSGTKLVINDVTITKWDDAETEVPGEFTKVVPTVTYYPPFTEVGNTVTLTGTYLDKVDPATVTVGGVEATVKAQTATTITIEMPSSITETTNAEIAFNGTEVTSRFNVVKSLLWDGNLDNTTVGVGVEKPATTGLDVGKWLYFSNGDGHKYELVADGSGHCFELNQNGKGSSWYKLQFGQEFEFPSGYTKGVLKFKAKTSVNTTNQLRVYITQNSNAKLIICEGDNGFAGFKATPFTTEWKEFTAIFDFKHYGTSSNSASMPDPLIENPLLEGYYHIRFTINGTTTISYYIDDITLEPAN